LIHDYALHSPKHSFVVSGNPVPTAPTVDDKNRTYPSPLFTIKGFLEALSNRCEDGRVIVERKGAAAKLRFILLNPASRLLEVVNEARATILVGGTMEPAGLLVCLVSIIQLF
ncbi:hypothetical protein OESDEN_22628, partial [Oesophagostomum dentatum]